MAKTQFPGKESRSTSFNLTAIGRAIIADNAKKLSMSQSDYLETVIREGEDPDLDNLEKFTSTKGGSPSYFFGKNRGTTTALALTPHARKLLDEKVSAAKMSRGDYVEALLRKNA